MLRKDEKFMFTIVFCDDDILYSKRLLDKILEQHKWNTQDINAGFFEDGENFINDLNKGKIPQIDLLILDIKMKEYDGIKVKNNVINDNRIKRIIFLTSHIESMGLAFGYKVHNFYVKGSDEEKLIRAIKNIRTELEMNSIVVYKNIPIPIENLLFVETIGSYSYLYMIHNDGSVQNQAIKVSQRALRSLFPSDLIIRASQSSLVNLMHVTLNHSASTFTLIRNPKIKIEISRRLRHNAKEKYMDFQIALAKKRLDN